jgi:hypothetical protein
MRRLRRFIHAGLCASSLLIFALAVIVWARSFRAWERVVFTTTHTDGVAWSGFVDHCVSWSRGNITFDRFTVERQGGPFSADHWHYARETPARPINADMNVPTDRVNVGFAGFRIRLNVDDERMTRVRLARIGHFGSFFPRQFRRCSGGGVAGGLTSDSPSKHFPMLT